MYLTVTEKQFLSPLFKKSFYVLAISDEYYFRYRREGVNGEEEIGIKGGWKSKGERL